MLQERQKWLKQRLNFKVGDLVIMKGRTHSRGQWPKALAEETLLDCDGVVHQVFVRSANVVFSRNIRKLCLLEEELLKKFETQGTLLGNIDTTSHVTNGVPKRIGPFCLRSSILLIKLAVSLMKDGNSRANGC